MDLDFTESGFVYKIRKNVVQSGCNSAVKGWYSGWYPGMVLSPGTHVEEPVLANRTLEVPMDFVKMSRIAEQVLWNEATVFQKRTNLQDIFLEKVMTRSRKRREGPNGCPTTIQ